MKTTKSALLVGVGGQGAILTAKVLVNGLMKAGYDVKMSEVHGMSQRGGSGLCQYPEGCLEAMEKHFRCHVLKAGEIAQSLGSAKCMNIVLFGSMVKALDMDHIDWETVIAETVPEKFRELNLRAYRAGRDAVCA